MRLLPPSVLVIGGGILFLEEVDMKYVLGLDIGIASVGWSVLDLDEKRIADMGVRAFNAAEDPKTRAPLAEPRRLARGSRRRLRRRAGRLRRAKDLFVHYGFIEESRRESAFETSPEKKSPWQLRAEGLDGLLTGEEFARALFHIIKRRGFKSNRKKVASEKDQDSKKMLAAIDGNSKKTKEHNYRTAGEMLWEDEKFRDHQRNTSGSYENTVDRELLKEEIVILFQRQAELGSQFAKPDIQNALVEVFTWQKPFASGDDVLKLIGNCTFEPGEKRAPRHSYHAERFNLLQKINSLTYTQNGDRIFLTPEQRKKIEKFAYDKAKVTYAQIRKETNITEDARFTALNYLRKSNKDAEQTESVEACEKSTFFELTGYHSLRKACGDDNLWNKVRSDPDLMDNLAYALTFFKTDEDISNCLNEHGVSNEIIAAMRNCDGFTKVIHLSTVAIKKILPYLEQGFVYSDACEKAGLKPPSKDKQDKLPAISSDVTRNPVVLRALSQSRKVVNAVIRRYGLPYRIHIELARDMGKSAEKRREIENQQRENRNIREHLEEQFDEKFKRGKPSSTDLLKWRLYREQDGKCAYSLQPLDIERLFEPGYAEIDHILPYSRSFDDGRSNKALALASENQKKKNQTPYEAFGHDEKRWEQYEGQVKAVIKDPKKRNNLLRENFDEKNEREWKDRNLSDTRYISREFSSFVRENLKFADGDEDKQHVVCINGQITARARWLWGLMKIREEDDLHHALDASVVAALLPHQVKMITEHAKVGEVRETYVDPETGEIIECEKPRLPYPWKGFRNEIEDKMKGITVSRMPIRKHSGAIHEETIRSIRRPNADEKPYSVVRKPLTSLSVNDLEKMFAPETNEKLYKAIRDRMAEYDNIAKKAFTEPLHKPTKDGTLGPIVKSVKVYQTQNTGILTRKGIADNGDMVRIDISWKKDKKGKLNYYTTPIYLSDTIRGNLVDIPGEFLFSLYRYDLMRVKTNDRDVFGYYRKYNCNNGQLTISPTNDNRKESLITICIKTALSVEKYEMTVLGNYHPVRGEVRRGLENGGNLESGETKD